MERRLRDPSGAANVDSLLDTVIALIADCNHETIKRLKNIEAYTNRCKLKILVQYLFKSNSMSVRNSAAKLIEDHKLNT